MNTNLKTFNFESYDRIVESANDWSGNSKQFNKVKWSVTEKVHGAKFVFHV